MSSSRLRLLDAARGFSVLSMVAFHYCYDLVFLCGVSLPWFAPPFRDIWRSSISWTFLFIAGVMCAMSRNNLKRALRYGAVALAIFGVTSLVAIDDAISFGIIYCIAACTMCQWVLQYLGLRPNGPFCALVFFAAFILLLGLPHGYVGIGSLRITVPSAWYATGWLSWLGLPGPHFTSGDYYPLLPYLLLYLCGSAMGWWWSEKGFPKTMYELGCAPLEIVGKLALPVYVLHQPLLLMLCGLL